MINNTIDKYELLSRKTITVMICMYLFNIIKLFFSFFVKTQTQIQKKNYLNRHLQINI